MTEATTTEARDTDALSDWEKRKAEAVATLRESTQKLVDVMASFGIEGVEAQFNGSGDSGEVEYVYLVQLDKERTASQVEAAPEAAAAGVIIPDECWLEVKDEAMYFGAMEPSEFPLEGDEQGCAVPSGEILDKLKSDMTNLAYDILSVHRGGWEINDGSYGSVRLTAKGRVVCDYTERYTAEEDNSFDYQCEER